MSNQTRKERNVKKMKGLNTYGDTFLKIFIEQFLESLFEFFVREVIETVKPFKRAYCIA